MTSGFLKDGQNGSVSRQKFPAPVPLAPATPPRLFRRPVTREAAASRVAYATVQRLVVEADGLRLCYCAIVLFQTRHKKEIKKPLKPLKPLITQVS